MEKKNRKSTLALWGILITAGLVLAGIELLSGVKHWSVIPTGKGAIDQAISPDETLLVVLNAGENSLSFIDLKTKIPFNKLYLPLEPLLPPAEGETPSYVLSSIEFSGDGSELLVTCVDGRFFVVDPVLQEVRSSGKALEPGLTLLGKGKVGKGVFALERAIGKLSLLGASGEVPVVLTQVPLVASAIDFRPKTTCGTCREFLVTLAYQVEGSGRLSLVEVDSSSLEVTQEMSVILPAGATFGDIRRGDEGSIVSVTYLDGSFDFLWVNNDGTIEEQEGEPLPGPEGEKIFRLCKSGMYLAHLNKGLFTLLTYDKDAKPLRLDMAPGGFDGAELRSMSAYPEQADSFASAIGPHEMLLGVPGWEGVVVFDASGQTILGFGNNNNDSSSDSCSCDLFRFTTPPFDMALGQVYRCEFYVDSVCSDSSKALSWIGIEVVDNGGRSVLEMKDPLPPLPEKCPQCQDSACYPSAAWVDGQVRYRAILRIPCDRDRKAFVDFNAKAVSGDVATVRYFCGPVNGSALFEDESSPGVKKYQKWSGQVVVRDFLIDHLQLQTANGWVSVEGQRIAFIGGGTCVFRVTNSGSTPWPANRPIWVKDGIQIGTGEQIQLTGPTVGSTELTANDWNYKRVNIDWITSGALKSIEFTSDHEDASGKNMLRDNATTWTDDGVQYTEPEWVNGTPPSSNPLSHTKGIVMKAKVRVQVKPSGVSFTVRGDGGEPHVVFEGSAISSGTDQDVIVEAREKLPAVVCKLSKTIVWTLGTGVSLGSSSHDIFVTWDKPLAPVVPPGAPPAAQKNVLTRKRLEWACTRGDADPNNKIPMDTIDNIAKAGFVWINTREPGASKFGPGTSLWPPGTPPIWMMLDPGFTRGACISYSNLLGYYTYLLGVSGGTLSTVYASKDEDFDFEDRITVNGETCVVVETHFQEIGPGEGFFYLNFWEGCFLLNDIFYPGAMGTVPFNSKHEVHNNLCKWPSRLLYCKIPVDLQEMVFYTRGYERVVCIGGNITPWLNITQEQCIPLP